MVKLPQNDVVFASVRATSALLGDNFIQMPASSVTLSGPLGIKAIRNISIDVFAGDRWLDQTRQEPLEISQTVAR